MTYEATETLREKLGETYLVIDEIVAEIEERQTRLTDLREIADELEDAIDNFEAE